MFPRLEKNRKKTGSKITPVFPAGGKGRKRGRLEEMGRWEKEGSMASFFRGRARGQEGVGGVER